MARKAAVEVAGYYPFPEKYIDHLAKLFNVVPFTSGVEETRYGNSKYTVRGAAAILDPCAGEGTAFTKFALALFGKEPFSNESYYTNRIYLYGVELEAERYKELEINVNRLFYMNSRGYNNKSGYAFMKHGDSFMVNTSINTEQSGADFLWLNPPYEHHKYYGRLETKFLERWTTNLAPNGYLLYIVPFHALANAAEFIANNYSDVTCYKFPEPDFEANFKQVILVGKRTNVTVTDQLLKETIIQWSENSDTITTLPELASEVRAQYVFEHRTNQSAGFVNFEMGKIDKAEISKKVKPFTTANVVKKVVKSAGHGNTQVKTTIVNGKEFVVSEELLPVSDLGLYLDIVDNISKPTMSLMQPNVAHLAMSLASGKFNGVEIKPNKDSADKKLPTILIRGILKREFVPVDEKYDKDGKKIAEIVVQQPTLIVSVRRIDNGKSFLVQPGTSISEADVIEQMTVADVIANYSDNLSVLMAQQFPPLHDTFEPSHQIKLIKFNRKPFKAQGQVIQAGLKKLTLDGKVLVLGEVGTGKSTIAMYLAGMLGPKHFNYTLSEIERTVNPDLAAQFVGKPITEPVHEALILCPPHLLKSWQDQVKFTLTAARTIVLSAPKDLEEFTARDLILPENEIRELKKFKILEEHYQDKILMEALEYKLQAGLPGYGQTFYILTRESAKLDGRYTAGVEESFGYLRCPNCGALVSSKLDRDDIKNQRIICKALKTKPTPAHKTAKYISTILASSFLEDANVLWHLKSSAPLTYKIKAHKEKIEALIEAEQNRLRKELNDKSFYLERKGFGQKLLLQNYQTSKFKATQSGFAKLIVDNILSNIKEQCLEEIKNDGHRHYSSYSNSNEKPVTKWLEVLLYFVAGIGEASLLEYAARQLWQMSYNTVATVKVSTGLIAEPFKFEKRPLELEVSHNYQSLACFLRGNAIHIASWLKLDSDQQVKLINEFKSKGNVVKWDLLDRTLARLREMKIIHSKIKAGIIFSNEAESYKPNSYGTFTDTSLDVDTGELTFALSPLGDAKLLRMSLTKAEAFINFKLGKECGTYLYQVDALSRNYETGFGNSVAGESFGKKPVVTNFNGTEQATIKYDNFVTKDGKNRRASNKIALAKYIMRFYPDLFQLLIVDELHEYNNAILGTAQGASFSRLIQMGKPVIGMTGSLMGGYASSLFNASLSLMPNFAKEYNRKDLGNFMSRYGNLKLEVSGDFDEEEAILAFGARSEKKTTNVSKSIRKVGEAPGILTTFITKFLLMNTAFIHKGDLDEELPTQYQRPIKIDTTDFAKAQDVLMWSRFCSLQNAVLEEIKKNMFTPGKAGKLWGAMVEMTSAPDLCHEETGNCEIVNEEGKLVNAYQITYPNILIKSNGKIVAAKKGKKAKEDEKILHGEHVATMPLMPDTYITPKEAWMLGKINELNRKGEKTLIFLRHTGNQKLVKRLMRLVKDHTTVKENEVAFLDSKKVKTSIREQWITDEIVDKGVKVLFVNPVTVQTGLNNLVYFNNAIYFEFTYNAYVKRQADGRLHRIGQELEVHIYLPFYSHSPQEIATRLLGDKTGASEQLDGLSIEGALQAAGISGVDESEAAEKISSGSIGKALYNIMQNQKLTVSR